MMESIEGCLNEKFDVLCLSKDVLDGNFLETQDVLVDVQSTLVALREGRASKQADILLMRKQLEAAKRITQLIKLHGDRIKTYENTPLPGHNRKPQSSEPNQEKQGGGTEKEPEQKPLNLNLIQHLTLTEYNAIPKYMKGRVQYETLSTAVEELNLALETKYMFMARKFSSLKDVLEKKRFKQLRAQESPATKFVHFITADELKESQLLKSELSRRNLFTILRHFKKIREIRGPGSIVRIAST
jgi:hypothetical protein